MRSAEKPPAPKGQSLSKGSVAGATGGHATAAEQPGEPATTQRLLELLEEAQADAPEPPARSVVQGISREAFASGQASMRLSQPASVHVEPSAALLGAASAREQVRVLATEPARRARPRNALEIDAITRAAVHGRREPAENRPSRMY